MSDLPYLPIPYDAPIVSAVQLLEKGECPAHLQEILYTWLVYTAGGVRDQSFRQDPYMTAFYEGRRFIGNTIYKFTLLDPKQVEDTMRRDK
jgi:hypothetical protein